MTLDELELIRIKTLKKIKKSKRLIYCVLYFFIFLFVILAFVTKEPRYNLFVFIIYTLSFLPKFINLSNKDKNIKTLNIILWISFKFIFLPAIIVFFALRFNWIVIIYIILILSIYFTIKNLKELWLEIVIDKKAMEFKSIVKNEFVKPYIENLGYKFSPNSAITEKEIKSSKLYDFALFGGNDRIDGKKDEINFSFSDIFATVELEKYPTHSLFFYADFNKILNSEIFIYSSEFLEFTHSSYQNMNLTTLDNAQFNRNFKVFTDKPKNAWYILTPLLMQQLLELKNIVNCPINVSFTGSTIYIWIITGTDSFEPNINQSVLAHNPTEYIEKDLNKIFEIIETLRLNRKIWSV